jgi:hypothetical protein
MKLFMIFISLCNFSFLGPQYPTRHCVPPRHLKLTQHTDSRDRRTDILDELHPNQGCHFFFCQREKIDMSIRQISAKFLTKQRPAGDKGVNR